LDAIPNITFIFFFTIQLIIGVLGCWLALYLFAALAMLVLLVVCTPPL
jgi:hypothetical protein